MVYRRRQIQLPNWAIPMLYSVIAFVGGLALPRIETRLLPGLSSSVSSGAALAIGSSIASGMIAFTAIVFSLAFVMVQFSATAYSPRLVLWIAKDRVIWHAIGVFTAAFIYTLCAMAWVDRNPAVTMPLVSAILVVVLLLASVAMFVALIERISLLQISRMLAFTGGQGRAVIQQMYPALEATGAAAGAAELPKSPVTQTVRHTGQPRVIQAVNIPALLATATASGGMLEVVAAVGDTVVEGTPLIRVYGARQKIEERVLRHAFETGLERTFEQDPKYAIRLLVDIAIKALSPAVNDPTTAVQALDHIEDLLLQLGRRRLDVGALRDRDGVLRVVIPHPVWDDFVILAFDEIRFYGATSVQVMRRMKALTSDLIAALQPERHPSLKHYQERLAATIDRSFADEEEKLEASIEDRQGLGVPRRH
jgi:uncharacterized membrane protein